MAQTKNTRIELRIKPEDKKVIKKAAKLTGLSLSAYIISRILPSAKNDLAKAENISLNNTDRDFFFKLLSNPPSPNKVLKNLLKSVS